MMIQLVFQKSSCDCYTKTFLDIPLQYFPSFSLYIFLLRKRKIRIKSNSFR